MTGRHSMHVIFLFVFALASPVFSADLTEEEKIEAELNPSKNTVNLEIEIARQLALQVNKNADWKAAASRITVGLKSLLKPYLDMYQGNDTCSKNANFTIYSAIIRGSTNYANCVTSASSQSQPRIDQLVVIAATVKAKTAASSISNFIQNCLKRFFSFNIFNVFFGCPSDFVKQTYSFMNSTVAEVKNEINASLSDSVKVAKCADNVTNEANRQATYSLSLYNYCKSRQVTTTVKPATNATQAPTNATQSTTQAPTQAPTNATQAPNNSTQAPNNATQAPNNATQAPNNATQAPNNATRAPTNATQATTQAPTQVPTNATQAPTQATTQAPTQATTQAPTQPTTPERANFSAIIQAAIDSYQQFEVRFSELQNLINDAVLTTQSNYGEILNLDLISLTDSVTNSATTSRTRIENIRSRNSNNPTVQTCYKTADDALNSLTITEGFAAQDCYFINSANMANLEEKTVKLETDFNSQRSQNGVSKIAECANDVAVNLSNDQVKACVNQVLTSTDAFLTASSNSSTNAIEVSKTIVASTTKCVGDASAKVRSGAQVVLDNFRSCTGISS